jgi:uncharacterized membrane protein
LRKNRKNKQKKKSHPLVQQHQQNSVAHPNNPNTQNQTIIARTETAFIGPIPPPELLAKYAEIIPNGADRILKMAENQSAHRQHIERWAVIGGTILSHFGVLCAAIIALSALYLGSELIRAQHITSGSIFAGSGLVALVGAFIYGTHSRKEERQQRDQRHRALIGQK